MIVTIVLFLFDIFLIPAMFLLSFVLRYNFNIPEYNFRPYKENAAAIVLIYLASFILLKLYRKRFTSFWELFHVIFKAMAAATVCGIIFLYILRYQYSAFPSSIFFLSFPIGLTIIFITHAFFLSIFKRIKKKVIVIGRQTIEEIMEERPRIEKIKIEKVEELLNYTDADEIVICEKFHSDSQMNFLVYLLLQLKIKVVFSPELYIELLSGNIMEQRSVQFLASFIGKKSDFQEFAIRALDVIGSILLIIILAPVIIIEILLISLTSSGPIFYKQQRLAKDGEPFILYKFRSMVHNAEKETGPTLAQEDDSRVTKIGRFLRQTRLDEVPQLYNIIKGDMSLVGPRPERPHFIKISKELRQHRLSVKPGLTGFAQIRKLYDLDLKHKIKYDYLYIQKRSVMLNLYILLKTIPVVLMGKGR